MEVNMTAINGLSISGIIMDIILFFIIAGNAVIGYRRGLAKVVFNICSSIIAIILVLILYKPTTNYIINNTKIPEKLESVFEENLQYLFEKDNIEDSEQLQNSDSMNSILKVFIGDKISDVIQQTTNSITKYLSVQITHKVISILVFFILFAIIRLILYTVKNYVELVANLPIIRIFNGSGGMIYGIIKGFLIIYVIFAIISIIMPIINDTIIMTAIQNAPIGSKMFNNNIILKLIFKFL
jgi:uncharacterized membrane protein required for colicin V production